MTARHCIAMSLGAALLAVVLFGAGVPGALLLVVMPTLVCVAMPFGMGHGDPEGEHLLEIARRASRPPQK